MPSEFLPHGNEKESRIDLLLKESEQQEQEITEELYSKYDSVRDGLIGHFRRENRSRSLAIADTLLIEKAQLVIDRILFIAFCEDRGLLPKSTLKNAYEFDDPYFPHSVWDNYKKIFEWINLGNPKQAIHSYNGGLFRQDQLLDQVFTIPREICKELKEIADFDFDVDVSVDVLGRIFEQSVTDLERIRSEGEGKEYTDQQRKQGKRKTQGIYYTPPQITQYIVDISLGEYLERYKPSILDRNIENEIRAWEDYGNWLKGLKVVDPACGSGAFLIAAFNRLFRAYQEVNRELARLKGDAIAWELDKTILNGNLYGVDLFQESVEITKLSLWLQTAQRGKTLIDLNGNIKVGNSIVDDESLGNYPFDWQAAFPEVFANGGFDVVLGNPPYVRQELLSPIKPYLQIHYQSYDGVADLYTYFYEKGVQILKPNGVLCYIVTNKWLRSGYGEALRRFFTQNSIFEKIIDFGHAPIFKEADVFPCVVSLRKEDPALSSHSEVQVCSVPRAECLNPNLSQYVSQNAFPVIWSRFTEKSWSLEPPEVEMLMQKIKNIGILLKDFAGVKPLYGIKTGFNEAFLIDNETKQKLIQNDPKCAEIIKPYLRGQDIKRWHPEWAELWIILIKSSANYEWAWSKSESEEAEAIFAQTYPSIYKYVKSFELKLRKRQDQGHYWWELRACAYYDVFERPKIIWKDLSTYSEFCLDNTSFFTNDLCFILSSTDLWILAVLNSPSMWSYLHRLTIHGINDTLRLKNIYTEIIPIAQPTPAIRTEVEEIVSRLIEITKSNQQNSREVERWIQSTHSIPKIGQKLENFARLSQDEFIKAIRDRLPKTSGDLSPKGLKAVGEVYQEYAIPIQIRQTEATRLEHRLNDLINQAYQLTPAEIDLMWRTAPPRMPITP